MNNIENATQVAQEEHYRKLIAAFKGSQAASVWYQARYQEIHETDPPENPNDRHSRPFPASTTQASS